MYFYCILFLKAVTRKCDLWRHKNGEFTVYVDSVFINFRNADNTEET